MKWKTFTGKWKSLKYGPYLSASASDGVTVEKAIHDSFEIRSEICHIWSLWSMDTIDTQWQLYAQLLACLPLVPLCQKETHDKDFILPALHV